MATQVMSIRIPQEVHDWLRAQAFKDRRSINQIVSDMLMAVYLTDAKFRPPVSETPETR